MTNLEYLDLRNCSDLEEVHRSLGCCRKLIVLNLQRCRRLNKFPCANVESLGSLILLHCSNLEKFPEILGRMKPELEIKMSWSGLREIPSSIIQQYACHLTELSLSDMKILVALPSSICQLKGLVKLDVSYCSKLESLPEEIGYLENLEELDAEWTLISHPPSSIVRLNKIKILSFRLDLKPMSFDTKESKYRVSFVFPRVNKGLRSLEILNLSFCNPTDGGLPEDIGCLSSLKELNLRGNNFERLPRSIAQLGSLRSLDLSECWRLKEFLGVNMAAGLRSLEILDLSYCNLIDGGLPEDIGCLSSLKELNLNRNNFERLPQSIAQLGSLRLLDLSECMRLKEFLGVNMAEGLHSLEILKLRNCYLINGGLLEVIGYLSSLKYLYLNINNFECLPQSIAQLGSLQFLDLSYCKRLKELPGFKGMQYLDTLDLNFCNLTDGGLPEDIGSLSSLKELNLCGNNFEHLPRSIAQLGALRTLDLSHCERLTQLPESPRQLHTIRADWSNDWIFNSLFQNISALQHDISASDSLSLRVFTSWPENIPSWFRHQGMGENV